VLAVIGWACAHGTSRVYRAWGDIVGALLLLQFPSA
jgi:hypothetical protein